MEEMALEAGIIAVHGQLVAKQLPGFLPANPPRTPQKIVSGSSGLRRKEGLKDLIGLLSSVGNANEAIRAVMFSALSSVVLPDPLGPMSTTTVLILCRLNHLGWVRVHLLGTMLLHEDQPFPELRTCCR